MVTPIVEKMMKNRFRWFGHVERRLVNYVVRRVDRVEGNQTTKDGGRFVKTIRKLLKILKLTIWKEVWF